MYHLMPFYKLATFVYLGVAALCVVLPRTLPLRVRCQLTGAHIVAVAATTAAAAAAATAGPLW